MSGMKQLPLILVFLVLGALAAATPSAADEPYTPPTITIDVIDSITPNSDITVRVTVQNTTGTRMWRSRVYLDIMSTPTSIRQHLTFYETEEHLTRYKVVRGEKDYMEPGEVQTATFRISVGSTMPAVTIPLYVALQTEIGLCEEGCAPYLRSVQNDIVVERNEPNIFLTLDVTDVQMEVGDCDIAQGGFSVTYTMENTSQTTAFTVRLAFDTPPVPLTILILPQMPLSSIRAGEQMEGTIYISTGTLSPGTIPLVARVTYTDYYGKSFSSTADLTITVVNDAYQLFMAGEEAMAECSYDEAAEAYEAALAIYEEVENDDMAQRCRERLARIGAVRYHLQAVEALAGGSYADAKTLYQQARSAYVQANDCVGVALCDQGILACNTLLGGGADTPDNGNGGGGTPVLTVVLVVIIAGLAGYIVLKRNR